MGGALFGQPTRLRVGSRHGGTHVQGSIRSIGNPCWLGLNYISNSARINPVCYPAGSARLRQQRDERVDVEHIHRAVVINVGILDEAFGELRPVGGWINQRQDERVDVKRVDCPIAIGVAGQVVRRAAPYCEVVAQNFASKSEPSTDI